MGDEEREKMKSFAAQMRAKTDCPFPPEVFEEDVELVKRTIEYLGPCPKCGGQRLPMISDVPKNRCMKCGAIERTKDKRCHRRTAEE